MMVRTCLTHLLCGDMNGIMHARPATQDCKPGQVTLNAHEVQYTQGNETFCIAGRARDLGDYTSETCYNRVAAACQRCPLQAAYQPIVRQARVPAMSSRRCSGCFRFCDRPNRTVSGKTAMCLPSSPTEQRRLMLPTLCTHRQCAR
jgi:hypothetical protein